MKEKLLRKTFSGFLLAGTLFACPVTNGLYAQSAREDKITQSLPGFSTDSAYGNFYFDLSSYNLDASFAVKLGEWFGTDGNHSFVLEKQYKDELNITHYIYQHYYKSLKVADELITLHEKGGKLTYINGEISREIALSPGSVLSNDAVKDAVAANIGTLNLKVLSSENVIAKIDVNGKVGLYSVTRADVMALQPLRPYMYYIDNNTGEVIRKVSKAYHADTPSVSSTLFKGNQPMVVDSYPGGFRLKDNSRNVHTLDGTALDGGVDWMTGELTGAEEYSNTSANFTATNFRPAIQVHWGMSKTHDYYLARHSRDSYDNAGSIIRNYYNIDFGAFVPEAPPGYGFNAMAMDMGPFAAMVYGNGNMPGAPNMANPVVALDVAGHEFTHLVISRNGRGGLNYQGESGALNESIADMIGTAIEFYSGAAPNWLIGEDVLNWAPGFLRSMSDPNSGAPFLGSEQPDTYIGDFWIDTASPQDNGGVHTNSGVGNYWFYLLSVGGSGTNDIGDDFSVTGITIEKAEKIIYRALTTYCTPNASYFAMYNYTRQAAADLYGANSPEALQNVKAWYAVGIGTGVLSTQDASFAESSVSVYPNPVSQGMFTINLSVNKDAAYELYDIAGKQIISSNKLSFGNTAVSVNGLQAGVYIVKVNIDGSVVSKKLIIN